MEILNYINGEWIRPNVKEHAVEFFTQKKVVVERWPRNGAGGFK